MVMPKAAMYEDRYFAPREHDIRAARQLTSVQAEANAVSMQGRANKLLGLGMLPLESGHQCPTSLIRRIVTHRALGGTWIKTSR